MTRMLRTLCVVGLFVGLASTAHADLIVIDPNDYTLGTDLSTMFPGVTLSRLTNQPNTAGPDGLTAFQPLATSVLATGTYHDPATLSFGGPASDLDLYDSCSARGSAFSSLCVYNVFEVRFDAPTHAFQLDSIFFSDSSGIIVYDTLGNRISGYSTTYSRRNAYDGAGTFTMTRSTADIGRIVFGGLYGAATATRVSYNVPEPVTLGFMTLGLAGAGVFARRRRQS